MAPIPVAVSPGLEEENLPTTGKRIAAARKMRGLTQTQLAERVGVARSSVANWERDHALPEADSLINLAITLECNARWLMLLDDSPIPYARVDVDQAALLEKWQLLSPAGREKLLEFAAFILKSEPPQPIARRSSSSAKQRK